MILCSSKVRAKVRRHGPFNQSPGFFPHADILLLNAAIAQRPVKMKTTRFSRLSNDEPVKPCTKTPSRAATGANSAWGQSV